MTSSVRVEVVHAEKSRAGNHFEYVIDCKVLFQDELVRRWTTMRRYSDFDKLYRGLVGLDFPCPSLPPKHLWSFHTTSFIAQRMLALNAWTQGALCLWQSVPSTDSKNAFLVGNLLESFLCDNATDRFYELIDSLSSEMKNDESEFDDDVDDHRVGERRQPATFADLARQSSSGVSVSSPELRSILAPPPDAMLTMLNERDDLFLSFLSGQQITTTRPNDLDRSTTFTSLEEEFSSRLRGASGDSIPSTGLVGMAVDVRSVSPHSNVSPTRRPRGGNISRSEKPFTATVFYPNDPSAPAHSLSLLKESSYGEEACTPVSVPPTPMAQSKFFQSWSAYTDGVLKFVAERLALSPEIRHETDSTGADAEGEESINESPAEEYAAANDDQVSPASSTFTHPPVSPIADAARRSVRRRVHKAYLAAGERLIQGLLRETARDDDAALHSWEFVDTAKNVMIFKKSQRPKKILSANLLAQCAFGEEDDSSNRTHKPSGKDASPFFPPRQNSSTAEFASDLFVDSSVKSSDVVPMNAVSKQWLGYMGQGVIVSASAAEIFEIVRRPSLRSLYDPLLKDHVLLENLNVRLLSASTNETTTNNVVSDPDGKRVGDLLVFHQTIETNRCFTRYERDFCVLQYAKRIDSGVFKDAYVVAGTSIEHPGAPSIDDCVRADIDVFGWIVEPLPTENNGVERCRVTYAVETDLGGDGIPSFLMDTLSFRQPLCVHAVRKLVAKHRRENEK